MRNVLRLVAGVVLGGSALAAPSAFAQEPISATIDGTTISVGGGAQFLWLPDINFTGAGRPGNFRFQTNSEFTEYGPAADARIETQLGYWGGYRVTGSLRGFWSNSDDTDARSCKGGCVVVEPATGFVGSGSSLFTQTSRDVDYWGSALEAKFWGNSPVQVRPNLLRTNYLLIGADVRGIDQNNDLNGSSSGHAVFRYSEDLNITYCGGYIGFGGEYSLGFLGTGGLWESLGLHSYFSARAGLYDAAIDYDGNFAFKSIPVNSRLSLSNDNLAFIGSVSFETRKQFSLRTSLSLWTDYEYISSAPQMRYSNGNRPTQIEDDGAFGSRSTLRLNIGLGPTQLYAPR